MLMTIDRARTSGCVGETLGNGHESQQAARDAPRRMRRAGSTHPANPCSDALCRSGAVDSAFFKLIPLAN
jgi:hypothetical protein